MVTSQNGLVVPFFANSAFGTICSHFNVCTPVGRQPQRKTGPPEPCTTKKLRRNTLLLSQRSTINWKQLAHSRVTPCSARSSQETLKHGVLACLPRTQPTSFSATRLI